MAPPRPAPSSYVDGARLGERGQKALRLRNYPPEKVAERVIDAIIKNRAVVPVNFEGHLLHALSRVSPGATRLLARIPAPR